MNTKPKDQLYVRYLAHLTSPFPDFDFGYIKTIRKKAVSVPILKNGYLVLFN